MSEKPTLVCEPNPKHKHKKPKGFGSLCPTMEQSEALELLREAVRFPDLNGEALWAVAGSWCFVARPTRLESNVWHGYPVLGSSVQEQVLAYLERAGKITRRQRRQLRKQKRLPAEWP